MTTAEIYRPMTERPMTAAEFYQVIGVASAQVKNITRRVYRAEFVVCRAIALCYGFLTFCLLALIMLAPMGDPSAGVFLLALAITAPLTCLRARAASRCRADMERLA